jgi:sugar lactone lactonase YvrE
MRRFWYADVHHNVQVVSEVVMKMFKVSMILMMAVLVMAGVVSAAPARIDAITDHIDGPFRVALDAQGNLYVTESQKNVVMIYSSDGKYLNYIPVAYPLGIAVDAAGKIYVGSSTSGKPYFQNSVKIYNPDLKPAGSLGIGEGEVAYPNDIAVSSDGKVYVVDTQNNLVKGYDLSTGNSFSFSSSFKLPKGIAVNDIIGEIYVVDVFVDASLNRDVGRIQIFDKDGQFRRSLNFPTSLSDKPVGIAIDSAGLLYVNTTDVGFVAVCNPADGSLVGTGISDPNKIMTRLQGIAISKNGLLYVISAGSEENRGRIDVFALDGYLTMAVDPFSLTFTGKQTDGILGPQTIIISNTSITTGGTLNWSATADQPWITLGNQDPAGPNSSVGLTVNVKVDTLVSGGTYTGKITIDSGFGQKKDVNVTVAVLQPNLLNITPPSLDFIAKKGTTPPAKTVTIAVNNLTGSVVWSAASNTSWLSISPASGTLSAATPATTSTVSVNTAGLKFGSYSGLLTVSAPGAIGTGSSINVILTITSTKITVSTNRADAKFSVNGPVSFTGSGSMWTTEDVPTGEYTVTFDAITGYKKPLPQTKTLADNSEVTFSGSFFTWQELAAKKNIVVAKGPGIKNDALLKAYRNNGTPAAFDMVALSTRYGANVAVGDVDGDGAAEIIVGAGDGPNNDATVRIYRTDKSLLTSFVPFATMNGVRVVAADLNGDGKAEIIASPAGGAGNTGKVTVYTYDTVNNKMIATGIEFDAYMYFYGANITAADIDGSGKPVIITAPGCGKQNPALIRVWTVDTTPAVGSWTVSSNPIKEISLPGTLGATVAAGDIDGDGKSEIIVGTSGEQSMITIIKADGTQTSFKVSDRYGVNITAADLDGDGSAEIITATGPSPDATADAGSGTSGKQNNKRKDGKEKEAEYSDADQERGAVRIFNASGVLLHTVAPFEDAKDGINVAVGDLGL